MKFICRKPGDKSREIIRRDADVISPSLTREYSFVFERGRGCYIWDVDGRRYLDFAAAVAVANVGHANREVREAILRQLSLGTHCGFSDFYAEAPVAFAEYLVSLLPGGLDTVFLSNSGTESVEAAYKLARWHTGKKWVIAFENAFHGRTMGSLSLTKSKPVQRDRFGPFLPVKHVHYPHPYRMNMDAEECAARCLDELEDALKKLDNSCAAVFLEPIQGEGGYVVPPTEFMRGVRSLCTDYGVLLCDDEVQAGCYRTGKFLGIQNFGVEPDVVCLSKAIGGGIPLGATVARREVMDWVPGSHANTFGGNLLACAAGLAALRYMEEKKLGDRAVRVGGYMKKRLTEMMDDCEIMGDVRGLGLMIGVEIVRNRQTREYGVEERNSILCKAFEKGLILLPAGRSVIRICPPLTLRMEEAEEGLEVLEESIRETEIKYRRR
jgi:4-aminobutyrate aminotransferase